MGMTMILTTHYMDEADALCDRIGIIDHGKVITLGTPEELKASLGAQTVLEVKVYEGSHEAILKGLEGQPFTEDVFAEGDKVMLRTNDKKAAAVHMLTRHADDVETLQFREPTLEDVFIELTGRELRE
jgi:ABC-2 type transport system ATP-binding protein